MKERLDFNYAKRHGVLITEVTSQTTVVAYRGTPSTVILAELQRHSKTPLTLKAMSDTEFESALAKTYEADTHAAMRVADDMSENVDLQALMLELPKHQDLLDMQDDAPIIHFLNALLTQAIKEAASDVHIETFEEKLVIRFRVDGILHEVLQPQRNLAPLIISRIKVMARLDIAEKRLPQDGRITLRIAGRAVDVRVSTLPSSHGERIVLRLLDKQSAHLNLLDLGMPDHTLCVVKKMIAKPHGIILVTGPTGSGKTTSLYAMLTDLNDVARNILTVEDPVEYYLEGIGQTQVNTKVDMTFARGLRAILRQDPDVVMVGEIRDLETAQIAVQASLTGHLVLSTLHTNSAIGALTRLRDMGIEPFLLSSSLIGVIAQRLIRKLCKHCKMAKLITPTEYEILQVSTVSSLMNPRDLIAGSTKQVNKDPAVKPQEFDKTHLSDNIASQTIYHAVGCEHCRHTGYDGRSGLYEVLEMDEILREMIHDNSSESQMKQYSRKRNISIREDGLRRVLAGDTTLEEILRVTSEE